ncbi:MAG: ferritin-like domain-containing protein [Kofleriaceae bacterium]|nr:ferritin-like domain-containing protein [Kofleriaceae bacterium]
MTAALFSCELWGGAAYARLQKRRGHAGKSTTRDFDWRSLATAYLQPSERYEARALWTNGVFTEYASGAAFASVAALLAQAGAPIDLIAAAADMAVDEMDHVELVSKVVMELGGAVPMMVDLPTVTPAPTPHARPLMQALEVLVNVSCIGENLSVPALAASRDGVEPPVLRAVLQRLLADEGQHAQLGFWALDWAQDQITVEDRRQLGQIASTALTYYAEVWRQDCGRCVPHVPSGGLTKIRYADIFHAAVAQRIVAPLARRGIQVVTPR